MIFILVGAYFILNMVISITIDRVSAPVAAWPL